MKVRERELDRDIPSVTQTIPEEVLRLKPWAAGGVRVEVSPSPRWCPSLSLTGPLVLLLPVLLQRRSRLPSVGLGDPGDVCRSIHPIERAANFLPCGVGKERVKKGVQSGSPFLSSQQVTSGRVRHPSGILGDRKIPAIPRAEWSLRIPLYVHAMIVTSLAPVIHVGSRLAVKELT